MGRTKGSKNKKSKEKTKAKPLKQQKKIHPIKKQKKQDDYLDLTKKNQDSKHIKHKKYLDKFDDWKATVNIVGAITIIVFCIAMGLMIKLLL